MLKYGNHFEKHYLIAYYHIFAYLKKIPYLRLPYLRKLSELSPYPITVFVMMFLHLFFNILLLQNKIFQIFTKLLKYGNKKLEEGEGGIHGAKK